VPTEQAFAAATRLEDRGGGTYAADVPDGWDIVGNVDGGLLLAVVGRALVAATGRPDPVTITAHYLRPGRAGPAVVSTEVVKEGRRFTTARATMHAGGQDIVTALATLGTLGTSADVLHLDGAPPELPPVGDCELVVSGDGFPPTFMDRVEVRLHPEDGGLFRGEPSGVPQVRGWFRLRDDEPIDTVGLLLAVDAFPPTIFNASLPAAWTPTVELTAHLRARPAPGWLACSFRTRFVTGGFLEVDGEVWDPTGALVAQSRQLALVPRG
jgi:acyl-CoA thioesterase